jgi:hypothetical protein
MVILAFDLASKGKRHKFKQSDMQSTLYPIRCIRIHQIWIPYTTMDSQLFPLSMVLNLS